MVYSLKTSQYLEFLDVYHCFGVRHLVLLSFTAPVWCASRVFWVITLRRNTAENGGERKVKTQLIIRTHVCFGKKFHFQDAERTWRSWCDKQATSCQSRLLFYRTTSQGQYLHDTNISSYQLPDN